MSGPGASSEGSWYTSIATSLDLISEAAIPSALPRTYAINLSMILLCTKSKEAEVEEAKLHFLWEPLLLSAWELGLESRKRDEADNLYFGRGGLFG